MKSTRYRHECRYGTLRACATQDPSYTAATLESLRGFFMRSKWIFAVAGVALLSALLVQVGPAQQGKGKQGVKAAPKQTTVPPGDWPLYSRDLMSDKFSPLTQINT